MKDFFLFLVSYIHSHLFSIFAFVLSYLIAAIIFYLFELHIEAVLYAFLLTTVILLFFLVYHVSHAYRLHQELIHIAHDPRLTRDLPKDDKAVDYARIIQSLQDETDQLETDMNVRYRDMIDYYTTWAHQIKTPISSMRLNLQSNKIDIHDLQDDLVRIEQYVDMVMAFLRTENSGSDLVFTTFDSDNMIKDCVRKLSSMFIRKPLRLIYEPSHMMILSDEKWLSFVVEQILTNALKYTQEGSITITCNNDKIMIKDTGIGIDPEDLPRVFERNYTGYNGRADKKASGIGLYLCKRICTKLGHRIMIQSAIDHGTIVTIYTDRIKQTD